MLFGNVFATYKWHWDGAESAVFLLSLLSLKSLCWQRRIVVVDIDLMLVLKPLCDVEKSTQ